MIIRIEKPLAIAIHERHRSEHGGGIGARDDKLVDSAFARPQQGQACDDPQADLADLAANLAFALARNPPFVDGNQRTTHVCYCVFTRAEWPGPGYQRRRQIRHHDRSRRRQRG